MKRNVIACLVLGWCASMAMGQADDTLARAQALFDAGQQAQARAMLERLSQKGVWDADFALAYQFVEPREESLRHYRNAAVHGHAKAMTEFLDLVLYRARDLHVADPQTAYQTFELYKKAAPSGGSEFGADTETLLKHLASVPPLDVDGFVQQYDLENDDDYPDGEYYVWQLAEEASRPGSRFGPPSALRTLQLILRGGQVPAEFTAAAAAFYDHYRKNEVVEFRIDDFVTSGDGANFLTQRGQDDVDAQEATELAHLEALFPNDHQKQLFRAAQQDAWTYYDSKAWTEELNDGTGFLTWAMDSINKHHQFFFQLVRDVVARTPRDLPASEGDLDRELAELSRWVQAFLQEGDVHGMHFRFTADDEETIEAQWQAYRKAWGDLLAALGSVQDLEPYRAALVASRVEDLRTVKEALPDYR